MADREMTETDRVTAATKPPATAVSPEELGPGLEPPAAGMLNLPLGTIIFRQGLLTSEQLEEALEQAARERRRLGEVLLERRLLDERQLAGLRAAQRGIPVVDVRAVEPDPEAANLLPPELARRHGAFALRREGATVLVAVADPTEEVLAAVRRVLGGEVRFAVAPRSDLADVISAVLLRGVPAETPPPDLEQRTGLSTLPSATGDVAPGETESEGAAAAIEVVVRLSDGDSVALGSYPRASAAKAAAEELIGRLGVRGASWPYVGNRFLRPEAIVSIDIVEQESSWSGSTNRARWGAGRLPGRA